MAPLPDAMIDEAFAQAPDLRVDRAAFKKHLAEVGAGEDANAADLLLAFACTKGDRAAMKELELRLARVSRPVLSRYGDEAFADEVLQEVREKLLVGANAKLRAYSGRGALVQYLKTVVTTTAIDRSRQQKPVSESESDEEQLEKLAADQRNADSVIFKARGKNAFSQAFKEALADLTAQERTLLRMKFVDGVAIEEIGRAFQVHRTTAMRWIEKIQSELLKNTRAKLQAQLKLNAEELEGVMKDLELSISDRLSRMLPALKR